MTYSTHRAAPLALAIALALTGCGGGGGGNVRPNPPPATPPPPATCQDTKASNYGGALPCVYRYGGEADNLLVPVGADLAHKAGFTGAGVKVGVLDDRKYEGYAPLEGRAVWYKDYTGKEADPDPAPKRGHGNLMAATIGGKPSAGFRGGVAPGSSLYWGAICFADACRYSLAAQAIADMQAQGVRLFNYSIGTANVSDRKLHADSMAAFLGGVVAGDSLFVASTANEGGSQPSVSAAIPAYHPQFAGNWLAVAAVTVDAAGSASGIASYANHCGEAANWCVVAPGLVMTPPLAGTEFQNGSQGTSNSAAIVTGSAALVWQAFPWMSARNVQQTLLTTATDLGAAGVDPVFGWGMVNVGKAIYGPGQFVGTFNANVTGNSLFSNPISGSGGLVKAGAGTLTLRGDHTYQGGSVVQGGTLTVEGRLGSGVQVRSGAAFASHGASITGNYTADAGATTAIRVGTTLGVSGTASLNGTVSLLAPASGYDVKPAETLLVAGNVTGRFGNVIYGSGFFYNAALSYSDTAVTAAMTRASAASVAMSSGAAQAVVAGGRQADALLGYTDALRASGNGAAHADALTTSDRLGSAPTAAAAVASLASLTGEAHGTARTLGVARALNDGQALGERTRSLGRFGEDGAWVQVEGADGRLSRDGYSRADYDQQAIRAGVDRALDAGLIVGAAIAGNRSGGALGGAGGRLEGEGAGVALYARQGVGEGGYVAGVLGYDRHRTDIRRSVLVGSAWDAVEGRRTDTAVQARIEGGIVLPNGLTPYMALGLLRHRQGAFAETGGAGLGLVADADTLTARFADAGLRFDHEAGQWVFGGTLAAQRILGGRDTDYEAAFVSAPAAGFAVSGQPLARDTVRIGGHLFYRTAAGWVWFVNAGTQRGGDARSSYGAAGVKIGF